MHIGLASEQYEWVVEANEYGGASSAKTVENLPVGYPFYFAVRSHNHDSSEVSAFSNEISATIPEPSSNDLPNQPPVVTSPGTQPGTEGEVVSLGIVASDPDGDPLTYSATGLPTGLSIDAQSGLISGTLGGPGSYSVTVTVFDGSQVAEAAFTWVVSAADQPPAIRTETGSVLDVTNAEWTIVNLDHVYDSMVVVATARYGPSAPPQIVRVRNAIGGSFELGMARADGSTANVSTAVDYLVVEEGAYDAATHGVTMEAVKYTSTLTDSKTSWVGERQTYANSYTNPVVIGQVMSANDPLPSSFWARGDSRANPPDELTLYTGKTVSEDPERVRADELIGYIVIEAGTGTLGNGFFEAGVGTESVLGIGNSPPYEYPLSTQLSAKVALLSMAAMNGLDGGWPVSVEDLDPSDAVISLAVDEDQLNDSERLHGAEQIAYLVLEHTEGLSRVGAPVTDVKVNGSDETAIIFAGESLPVTIALDAGSYGGQLADWWIILGVDSLDQNGALTTSYVPISSFQEPLFNLEPLLIMDASALPSGTYTVFFIVDTVPNDQLDEGENVYWDASVIQVN